MLGREGPLASHAFEIAQQAGDLTYAAISRNNLLTQLLASGAPLAEVQHEAEAGLDFARRAHFALVGGLITAQLQLIRTLRGLTPVFGCFDDDGFDEQQFERRLEGEPSLGIAAWMYWIRKLQARPSPTIPRPRLAAAAKAERLLWMSPAIFERADYHFYAALALIPLCEAASDAEQAQYQEGLAVHYRQLQAWAEHCPENFASRGALIAAEIARMEGRELDAERLYEQAIRSARANALLHDEAIAYERAAAFYLARGFDEIAALYLRNARHGYLRWGADGKVRKLEDSIRSSGRKRDAPGPTGTIGARVEHLDLATVIKVSQAVSGEFVLEKLIDTLMRTALAQAGAERALLILARGAGQKIAAEAIDQPRRQCSFICVMRTYPKLFFRSRCFSTSCARGRASFSKMLPPGPRLPPIRTSVGARPAPCFACHCSTSPDLSERSTSRTTSPLTFSRPAASQC